jgi:hypothetical protein
VDTLRSSHQLGHASRPTTTPNDAIGIAHPEYMPARVTNPARPGDRIEQRGDAGRGRLRRGGVAARHWPTAAIALLIYLVIELILPSIPGLHLYAAVPVLRIGPLAFLVTEGPRVLGGRLTDSVGAPAGAVAVTATLRSHRSRDRQKTSIAASSGPFQGQPGRPPTRTATPHHAAPIPRRALRSDR